MNPPIFLAFAEYCLVLVLDPALGKLSRLQQRKASLRWLIWQILRSSGMV